MKRLLQRINRTLPFVRTLMPMSVKRWLIWNLMGGRADYETKHRLPSRKYLEMELLPWLCKSRRSVLFVGAGAYTYPYYHAFEASRLRFVTIDLSPAAQVWGAREHYVGSILDVEKLIPPPKFDSVVCNGVFGFGVEGIGEMNRALNLFAELLHPEGVLLLGWNKDVVEDPLALEQAGCLFETNTALPFPPRKAFSGETHVYDVLALRPQ